MAPTAVLSNSIGSEIVLRMPCSAAARRNSGHGPSSRVDSICVTRRSLNASTQGPVPVSYWAWSISGAVSSVNTAVRCRPSTNIVMPAKSAGATASTVNSVTRDSVCCRVPSPTKKRESASRLSVRGESATSSSLNLWREQQRPLAGQGTKRYSSFGGRSYSPTHCRGAPDSHHRKPLGPAVEQSVLERLPRLEQCLQVADDEGIAAAAIAELAGGAG